MKTPRISVVLSADEMKRLRAGVSRNTSDSNVIRKRLNLDPMAHGGLRNGHKTRKPKQVK